MVSALLAIFGILASRAVHIFPLAALLNRLRAPQLDWRTQVILWFSGLRGAIAFTMALAFPISASRDTVVSTTMFIVVLTTLGLGGLTAPFVRLVGQASAGLTRASSDGRSQPLISPAASSTLGSAFSVGAPPSSAGGRLWRAWRTLDRRYMQVWFGGAAGPRRTQRGVTG